MTTVNDLEPINQHIKLLLNALKPVERKHKLKIIGRELRKANQKRIQQQQNPDGSAFAPRRKTHTKQRAKKMFIGLRKAKRLKISANASGVSVGFSGRNAKIARIHQFGQRDVISAFGQTANFTVRELIGLTADDQDMITEVILNDRL